MSGLFGLLTLFVNVVISVVVGAWALRRRVRDDANVKAEERAQGELTTVRNEYRTEIRELRKEINTLRARLEAKDAENRTLEIARVRQDERIVALEERVTEQDGEIAVLKTELAECVSSHGGRGAR